MQNFLSLKKDSETVAGCAKIVEATSKEKYKKLECWNCSKAHFTRECKSEALVMQEVQDDRS